MTIKSGKIKRLCLPVTIVRAGDGKFVFQYVLWTKVVGEVIVTDKPENKNLVAPGKTRTITKPY